MELPADASYSEQAMWVLDRGLLPLPDELAPDEMVAIARWSGQRYGAVLFVLRHTEAGADDVDTEVYTFRRTADGWVESLGSGGGGWFDEPLRRQDGDDDFAVVGHCHYTAEEGGSVEIAAAYGWAGASAVTVEVEDASGVSEAALDSPVGAFVVAADGSADAIVRVLDADGRVLTQSRISPGR